MANVSSHRNTTEPLQEEWLGFRRSVLGVSGAILALLGPFFAASEFSSQSLPHNAALLLLMPIGLGTVGLAWTSRLRGAVALLVLGILPTIAWVHVFTERGDMAILYLVPVLVIGMVGSDRRSVLWVPAGILLIAIGLRLARLRCGVEVDEGVWATSSFDVLTAILVTALLVELTLRRIDRNEAILADALDQGLRLEEAARRASEEKSDFLARVSHELRTPLNAILGYAELLEEDEAVEVASRPDLGRIHAAGTNLLALIDDVLDLSKVEAGRMELDLQSVRLDRLLDGVRSVVQPLVARKGNRLLVDYAGDATVVLDERKVSQVLLNLLSNAARFTENGTITVVARLEPSVVVFTVTDTGIGIPQGRLHTLFEPFVQVSASTSTQFGGTGLGLALCDRFVRRMGGHIDVSSRVDEGSRFRVVLPIPTA